jgi:hypothetical protein
MPNSPNHSFAKDRNQMVIVKKRRPSFNGMFSNPFGLVKVPSLMSEQSHARRKHSALQDPTDLPQSKRGTTMGQLEKCHTWNKSASVHSYTGAATDHQYHASSKFLDHFSLIFLFVFSERCLHDARGLHGMIRTVRLGR